jgi:hypothetical protein
MQKVVGSSPIIRSRFPDRVALPPGEARLRPASRRSAPSSERPVRPRTVPLAYGHGATRQETESEGAGLKQAPSVAFSFGI